MHPDFALSPADVSIAVICAFLPAHLSFIGGIFHQRRWGDELGRNRMNTLREAKGPSGNEIGAMDKEGGQRHGEDARHFVRVQRWLVDGVVGNEQDHTDVVSQYFSCETMIMTCGVTTNELPVKNWSSKQRNRIFSVSSGMPICPVSGRTHLIATPTSSKASRRCVSAEEAWVAE